MRRGRSKDGGEHRDELIQPGGGDGEQEEEQDKKARRGRRETGSGMVNYGPRVATRYTIQISQQDTKVYRLPWKAIYGLNGLPSRVTNCVIKSPLPIPSEVQKNRRRERERETVTLKNNVKQAA